jgi:hypothetical protein
MYMGRFANENPPACQPYDSVVVCVCIVYCSSRRLDSRPAPGAFLDALRPLDPKMGDLRTPDVYPPICRVSVAFVKNKGRNREPPYIGRLPPRRISGSCRPLSVLGRTLTLKDEGSPFAGRPLPTKRYQTLQPKSPLIVFACLVQTSL